MSKKAKLAVIIETKGTLTLTEAAIRTLAEWIVVAVLRDRKNATSAPKGEK